MSKQTTAFLIMLVVLSLSCKGEQGIMDPSETPVNIWDPGLRAVIEDSLGTASGAPITRAEMAILTRLVVVVSRGISDLTGIEFATNLTELEIVLNRISDVSALAGLTNLTWLNLRINDISDLLPLAVNWGLGRGDFVNVRVNPLSATSLNAHIPALRNRGVEVIWY